MTQWAPCSSLWPVTVVFIHRNHRQYGHRPLGRAGSSHGPHTLGWACPRQRRGARSPQSSAQLQQFMGVSSAPPKGLAAARTCTWSVRVGAHMVSVSAHMCSLCVGVHVVSVLAHTRSVHVGAHAVSVCRHACDLCVSVCVWSVCGGAHV